MAKTFIAQVYLVIEADDYADACDSISAALTDNLQHSGAVLEWGYALKPDSDSYTGPRESDITPAEFIEDGRGAALDTMFSEATEFPALDFRAA